MEKAHLDRMNSTQDRMTLENRNFMLKFNILSGPGGIFCETLYPMKRL